MRIIVDGDSCPGKTIVEKVAKEHNIEVIIYCDINHVINSEYSTVIYVDSGFQTVDMKIANIANKNDIIITQDFGVAAMVLSKDAFALSPKGNIYSSENIDRLLFERHISQKVRKSGGKTKNAKKRNAEDDKRLEYNLKRLIKENMNLL